ncbi:MAG: DUF6325 family protein [Caldilineaceae bacterium]
MHMAPVSYLVIEFRGNQFKGDIAPTLDDLVERGVVRIMDLLVVLKDNDGAVSIVEVAQLPGEAMQSLARYAPPETSLLSEGDAAILAESLQNNSSAGILVLEHLWAKPFAEAVANAGGRWVMMQGVPPDVLEEALADLPE